MRTLSSSLVQIGTLSFFFLAHLHARPELKLTLTLLVPAYLHKKRPQVVQI